MKNKLASVFKRLNQQKNFTSSVKIDNFPHIQTVMRIIESFSLKKYNETSKISNY